jgi:hypothetical protein
MLHSNINWSIPETISSTYLSASNPRIVIDSHRNGRFFAATNPNTLQINEHNAIQNGSVTNEVAAWDYNYSQSAITTISFP